MENLYLSLSFLVKLNCSLKNKKEKKTCPLKNKILNWCYSRLRAYCGGKYTNTASIESFPACTRVLLPSPKAASVSPALASRPALRLHLQRRNAFGSEPPFQETWRLLPCSLKRSQHLCKKPDRPLCCEEAQESGTWGGHMGRSHGGEQKTLSRWLAPRPQTYDTS